MHHFPVTDVRTLAALPAVNAGPLGSGTGFGTLARGGGPSVPFVALPGPGKRNRLSAGARPYCVRTPGGIVIVMSPRLAAAVEPTRCAQAAGERIQSGRPAGASYSGISTSSSGWKASP